MTSMYQIHTSTNSDKEILDLANKTYGHKHALRMIALKHGNGRTYRWHCPPANYEDYMNRKKKHDILMRRGLRATQNYIRCIANNTANAIKDLPENYKTPPFFCFVRYP